MIHLINTIINARIHVSMKNSVRLRLDRAVVSELDATMNEIDHFAI